MSEQKQVVVQDKPVPVPMGKLGVQLKSMEDLYRFSKAVAVSGFAPKGMEKPESIMIAIQLGMEVGLTPVTAVRCIAVVNGRPTIYGDMALALVNASGLCEEFEEGFTGKPYDKDYTAFCTVRRTGRKLQTQTFSVEDATKAGLWGKDMYAKYPRRMLQMRARGFALRDQFSDVLNGLHLREEMIGVIDVTPDDETVPEKPKPVKTLDDVVERYTEPESDPVEDDVTEDATAEEDLF